ncbi:hypothetical protein OWT26_09925 [Burkholderia sp. 1A5]
MRFAFAGFDRWRVVFDAFVAAGWEPVALYSIPVDNRLDFNSELVECADKLRIPVQLSRIDEDDLRWLAERQCEALIVAGYNWKIPAWQPYLRHAANFHPSPLPDGRGPYRPCAPSSRGGASGASVAIESMPISIPGTSSIPNAFRSMPTNGTRRCN